MNFKKDITRKIKSDFMESSDEAFALLESAMAESEDIKADRIIRCIVFLAHGKIVELSKFIKLATLDPRDVMLATEYENNGNDSDYTRIRDLSHPFDDEEEHVNE